jgi:3-deoxy-D-manno-octulosonic-acid transferase
MLESFTHFFVQNEASKKLLGSIGITQNVTVSGDTRFDRVTEIVKTPPELSIINAFCGNSRVMVAGSTWEDDEVILSAYADETQHQLKLIIVPHELDREHLDTVKKMFKQSICYTDAEKKPELLQTISNYKVLIVDTMGLLSRLYSFGYINYVGGGFTNDGIHNILEAAVWGRPVIIGENYAKYFEAVDLVDCGAAESISNTNELREVVEDWEKEPVFYKESAGAAKKYVYDNAGATRQIMNYIQVNRLLTS